MRKAGVETHVNGTEHDRTISASPNKLMNCHDLCLFLLKNFARTEPTCDSPSDLEIELHPPEPFGPEGLKIVTEIFLGLLVSFWLFRGAKIVPEILAKAEKLGRSTEQRSARTARVTGAGERPVRAWWDHSPASPVVVGGRYLGGFGWMLKRVVDVHERIRESSSGGAKEDHRVCLKTELCKWQWRFVEPERIN